MSYQKLHTINIRGQLYDIGDADLDKLLGGRQATPLGDAAFAGLQTSGTLLSNNDVATSKIVKEYIDSHNSIEFYVCKPISSDIPSSAIYKSGTTVIYGSLSASEALSNRIYLVKFTDDETLDIYEEWIKAQNDSGQYYWQKIGSTSVDLSNYVKKTTTIAGISLQNNISTPNLQAALGIENLGYKEIVSEYVNTTQQPETWVFQIRTVN